MPLEKVDRPTRKIEFFLTLQAGRGIASLLVVLFHLSTTIFAHETYWGHDPFNSLFRFGRAGVEFFFVLSGFIMLHMHWDDLNKPRLAVPYLKKRFCRIYPIYWIVLALIAPVYFLVPTFGHGYEQQASVILSSITLFHFASGYTILTVAWTLYHEVMFYLIFCLSILHRRLGALVLGVWLMGSIFRLSSNGVPTTNEFIHSSFDYFLSPLHLLFAFGMLACWALRNKRVYFPAAFAVSGVALFLLVGLDEDYLLLLPGNIRVIMYGVGCTTAITGFIALEMQGRLEIPRLLSFLGDASYSIYLTHLIVISFLAKMLIKTGAKTHIPEIVAYVALLITALIIGVMVHLFVEKPLVRRIRAIISA